MTGSEKLWYPIRVFIKAYRAHISQIILVAVLAFLSSALEGIGITSLIPVVSFVSGGGGAATDTASRLIAGTFALLHVAYTFKALLIFIAVLFIMRTLLLFAIININARIIYAYEINLRQALFNSTINARWPFLSRQRIGNLEQLLTTNTANASQFFSNISASVIVVSKVLMYITLAINISWWVALLSLVAGVLVFFVLKPLFYRGRLVAIEGERLNRQMAHFVGEHVIGMKAIKAMALEEPVSKRANSIFRRVKDLNYRSVVLRSYIQLIVSLSGVLFVGIVFAILYKSGGFSIAAFGVIVYAINQIFTQIQAGQVQLHTVSSMLPYIDEALRFMDGARENEEAGAGDGEFSLKKMIRFDDVSFSYQERDPVLFDVSFEIKRGELVGIIGPSGAGKTTIADLLLRLVEPTGGQISIDGVAITDIAMQAWRHCVGYVSQDAVLLNDTIESNIVFYSQLFTHEDVVAAAKQANIHEFIESLPEGYQTMIGDRGMLLSGGQRQRVALARVLARKPELLVLDEATSSLDAESERAIQAAILKLRGSVTVVVIAHRMTTVADVDQIIVLEQGRVIEQGTPEALQGKEDSYFARALRTGNVE